MWLKYLPENKGLIKMQFPRWNLKSAATAQLQNSEWKQLLDKVLHSYFHENYSSQRNANPD